MRRRLRFAPSPSGGLHVGNARTALFNWLFARGGDGDFILRIENTDVERSTEASERSIVDDLRWMGLDWTEGVVAGGDHGPYRQSERLHIYRAHVVELMSSSRAYRCFCSAEQLETDRAAAFAEGRPPKYVGRCRDLPAEQARQRVQDGEQAVIRLRVPQDREITFHDLVRGEVRVHADSIGDAVLVRSNGTPAYNFAAVIDDALMEVTHVIRGEDHISNTPLQMLLYEAFGWTPPTFAHVPFVMGVDQTPLSKRRGAASVADLRARGYLPEAVTNYLALLGWSPGEGEELLPLEELARRFRLDRVGRSAGILDVEKLAWVNRHYLKLAPPRRLATLAVPYFQHAGWLGEPTPVDLEFLEQVVQAVAASVDRLEQMPSRLEFLFAYSAVEAMRNPTVRAEAASSREVIAALASELAERPPLLDRDAFRGAAAQVRQRTGQKGRALLHPIRLALTGAAEGLELDLAVPAIERGARLTSRGEAGSSPSGFLSMIPGAAERAAAFQAALDGRSTP